MKTVWKITLDTYDGVEQKIELPEGAKFLNVEKAVTIGALKYPRFDLWFLVDTAARPEQRSIRITGTGEDLDSGESLELLIHDYLGTVVVNGGLVLHFWDNGTETLEEPE